jgi:hypothetical protein
MVTQLETVQRCQAAERLVKRRLNSIRNLYVAHRAAQLADQVVMMAGKVFGQLEASPFVVGDNFGRNANLLEHSEIAIHRALRQFGVQLQDVGDRYWMIGPGEDVYQPTPQRCVSLIACSQTGRSDLVHIETHRATPVNS